MGAHSHGIVCVSGGLDSAVTAAIANEECRRLSFLHVNYGQRTEKKELQCFFSICDYYNVRSRFVADISYLKSIGGSSLVDESIPVEKADLIRKEIPSSYVPFRNAHILSIAISWAEVLGTDAVYIGAVFEDSSGYPDCRPEFYNSFQKVVDIGTKPETKITIETPVISFSKAEIVRKGNELGAPFHLTWSCYKNEDVACGECDSCALRLRGFQQAGIEDPIIYKKRLNYTE